MVVKPLTDMINHLLAREKWARERLKPYIGRWAHIAAPPFTVIMAVQPDGWISLGRKDKVDAPLSYDVSITLSPVAFLTRFIQRPAATMQRKHIRVEGDAEFAATLAFLAEHLRWEPDEDLSRLIGDAPAYRMVQILRKICTQARRCAHHLLETIADYWLEENPQLVRQKARVDFDAAVIELRDDVGCFEKRLIRLETIYKSPARL